MKLAALLRDGSLALVCDDLDDATVWATAAHYRCKVVVMVPEGREYLERNLHPSGVWERVEPPPGEVSEWTG